MPYLQRILFQSDAGGLLKAVELFGIRGISQPQFYLQASADLEIIRDGPTRGGKEMSLRNASFTNTWGSHAAK
jgi:hypothetical protein